MYFSHTEHIQFDCLIIITRTIERPGIFGKDISKTQGDF